MSTLRRSRSEQQRIDRINRDLRLVQFRYGNRVSWSFKVPGNWFIRIEDVPLPPVCRPPRTNMKIMVPDALYQPIKGQPGRFVSWRDVYIDPGLQISRGGRWEPPPRYSEESDGNGWHYLCVHLLPADERATVLDFIEAIRVHLATYAR